jgi:hypothetical protein
MVSPRPARPYLAAWLADSTIHSRSPCRKRFRWKATGETIRAVVTTDAASVVR